MCSGDASRTHEKRLSNVFAWLFTIDATLELGDAAQRIFLDLVNESLPPGDQARDRIPGDPGGRHSR